MRKARILIVDDEPGILEVCKDTLEYLDEVGFADPDPKAKLQAYLLNPKGAASHLRGREPA